MTVETLDDAFAVVTENLPYRQSVKRFYGTSYGVTLGVGMLYAQIRQPAFDKDSRFYKTVRGAAYVITHECDVSQANARIFNDAVLICPLIRFEDFFEEFKAHPNLGAFLGELATRDVYRAVYIPPIGDFEYGAVLYLNRISSTDVRSFSEEPAQCIGTVSALGLREIDAALSNLLMREKADMLTDMGY
jgi:hypothetical protein